MNYTSLVYYFFLIVLLVIYYLLPMKYRWISLLAASIIFYYSVINSNFPQGFSLESLVGSLS